MLVISHFSALQAIRYARKTYSALPWSAIGRVEQRKALNGCIPTCDSIDFNTLSRYGIWNDDDLEELHVLVASSGARRNKAKVRCHVWSSPLPNAALLKVAPDIYCCSPAFTALQCSIGKDVAHALMVILELLGTYALPPESTFAIAHRGHWPDFSDRASVEQAHYRCEPATILKELRAIAKWTKSSSASSFRQAVQIAAEGSASPGESIMFGMFGTPKRYGGFGCNSLPKGGMLLNRRLDFSRDAMHMASGMPYAILDAMIPAAKTDLEYNGLGHEQTAARIHDGNRNNGLKGMGYKVIVINRDQMRDVVALEAIARSIYRDAGVRFRYSANGYRNRQVAMLNGLRAATGLAPI